MEKTEYEKGFDEGYAQGFKDAVKMDMEQKVQETTLEDEDE